MKEHVVIEAHGNYVLEVAFTLDGRTLISTGMDSLIKFWSVPDWEPVKTLDGHANSVNTLALSPDGSTLVTGSTDATVKLWSLPDGTLRHSLQDRAKTVAAVRVSPDGAWLAAGSYGGRVAVWTMEGQDVVRIKASEKNLAAVSFVNDSQVLATGGLGDRISLWALPSGEPLVSLPGHETAVTDLRAIHEGCTLVSLGHEGTVRFWDTKTWEEVRSIQLAGSGVRGLAISRDEKTMAVALESKVQLWAVDDGTLLTELPVGTKAVNGMAFSPDGAWLAVGAADGKIRIWTLDRELGEEPEKEREKELEAV